MGHLTKTEVDDIQDGLNTFADDAYWQKETGKGVEAKWTLREMQGALKLTDSLGLRCQCFPVTKKMQHCVCGLTETEVATKRKNARKLYASVRAKRR